MQETTQPQKTTRELIIEQQLVNLKEDLKLINTKAKYQLTQLKPLNRNLSQISVLLKKKLQNCKFNQHVLNENHFHLRDSKEYQHDIHNIFENIKQIKSRIEEEIQEKQIEDPSPYQLESFGIDSVDQYLSYNQEIQLSNQVNSIRQFQNKSIDDQYLLALVASKCNDNISFLTKLGFKLIQNNKEDKEVNKEIFFIERNENKSNLYSESLMRYTTLKYQSKIQEKSSLNFQIEHLLENIQNISQIEFWKILKYQSKYLESFKVNLDYIQKHQEQFQEDVDKDTVNDYLKQYYINEKMLEYLEDDFKHQLNLKPGPDRYQQLSDFAYKYFNLSQKSNIVRRDKPDALYNWAVIYLLFRSGQYQEMQDFLQMLNGEQYKKFTQWFIAYQSNEIDQYTNEIVQDDQQYEDIFYEQLLRLFQQDSHVIDDCFIDNWNDYIWLSLKTCQINNSDNGPEKKLNDFTLQMVQQKIIEDCKKKDDLESISNLLICQAYTEALEKFQILSYKPKALINYEDILYVIIVMSELNLIDIQELSSSLSKWIIQVQEYSNYHRDPSKAFLIMFYLICQINGPESQKDQRKNNFTTDYAKYVIEENLIDDLLLNDIESDIVILLKSLDLFLDFIEKCVITLNGYKKYKKSLEISSKYNRQLIQDMKDSYNYRLYIESCIEYLKYQFSKNISISQLEQNDMEMFSIIQSFINNVQQQVQNEFSEPQLIQGTRVLEFLIIICQYSMILRQKDQDLQLYKEYFQKISNSGRQYEILPLENFQQKDAIIQELNRRKLIGYYYEFLIIFIKFTQQQIEILKKKQQQNKQEIYEQFTRNIQQVSALWKYCKQKYQIEKENEKETEFQQVYQLCYTLLERR